MCHFWQCHYWQCHFCLCHSVSHYVVTVSALYLVTLLFWMHHAERRDAECIVCMLIDWHWHHAESHDAECVVFMLRGLMLSVFSLCWITLFWMSWCWVCCLYVAWPYAECDYAECIVFVLSDIVLNVMILTVLSLCWVSLSKHRFAVCYYQSVIMPSVITVRVVMKYAVLLSAILPECRGAIFTRLLQCPIWNGW